MNTLIHSYTYTLHTPFTCLFCLNSSFIHHSVSYTTYTHIHSYSTYTTYSTFSTYTHTLNTPIHSYNTNTHTLYTLIHYIHYIHFIHDIHHRVWCTEGYGTERRTTNASRSLAWYGTRGRETRSSDGRSDRYAL